VKATVKKCDQCGETIPEDGRRFKLQASVTIVNGHERLAASALPDLCGEACVIGAVTALIREAEKMPMIRERGVAGDVLRDTVTHTVNPTEGGVYGAPSHERSAV